MLKPINTLTSLATLVMMFAMIQALDPTITRLVASGKIEPADWWLLIRTATTTVLAIAIKNKENPLEYTPKGVPGESIDEVYDVLRKIGIGRKSSTD